MLDSIDHYIKNTKKRHFQGENLKIFPLFIQRYSSSHNVTLLNLLTTSGLSILLHGVISLRDGTSCDKRH